MVTLIICMLGSTYPKYKVNQGGKPSRVVIYQVFKIPQKKYIYNRIYTCSTPIHSRNKSDNYLSRIGRCTLYKEMERYDGEGDNVLRRQKDWLLTEKFRSLNNW